MTFIACRNSNFDKFYDLFSAEKSYLLLIYYDRGRALENILIFSLYNLIMIYDHHYSETKSYIDWIIINLKNLRIICEKLQICVAED